MNNEISTGFCPHCGHEGLRYPAARQWICDYCGFSLYKNVAASVGIIFYTEDNQVLFEIRKRDPKKGFLDLPGGFCDPDEPAEDTCVREFYEETGLKLERDKFKFLCTSPNTYEYKGINYKTCDMFFCYKTDISDDGFEDFLKTLTAEEDEVDSFKICRIEDEAQIDKMDLAFNSFRVALKNWLKIR